MKSLKLVTVTFYFMTSFMDFMYIESSFRITAQFNIYDWNTIERNHNQLSGVIWLTCVSWYQIFHSGRNLVSPQGCPCRGVWWACEHCEWSSWGIQGRQCPSGCGCTSSLGQSQWRGDCKTQRFLLVLYHLWPQKYCNEQINIL